MILARPIWSDVSARARGLAAHLLDRRALERLAAAKEIPELAFDLDRAGFAIDRCAEATAADLERAVRRVAARRFAVIARWCGPARAEALAAFFEDEDRRSLRALVRGALAGIPPAERVLALLPTPALPERALSELAAAASPREVAALLATWKSPYASAIAPETRRAHPDLFALDGALGKVFAARALEGARRGGREVRAFAEETIDVENALAALLIAAEPAEVDAEACFVPGGKRLGRATFAAAAATRKPVEAARLLGQAFAGTPLEEAFRLAGPDLPALERAILAARIRALVRAARRDPLGAAPVLAFLLRVRAEAADIRRAIFGVALGAPRETIGKELVTP